MLKSTKEWLLETRFQRYVITNAHGLDLDKPVDLESFCTIIMYCSLDWIPLCEEREPRELFMNSYKVTNEQRDYNFQYTYRKEGDDNVNCTTHN